MRANGLQGLLRNAETEGTIKGVSICKNGPRVSHLFFANDSVLFCHAKESAMLSSIFYQPMRRGPVKKSTKTKSIFSLVQIPNRRLKLESNIS